jgi:hypothetical protein
MNKKFFFPSTSTSELPPDPQALNSAYRWLYGSLSCFLVLPWVIFNSTRQEAG